MTQHEKSTRSAFSRADAYSNSLVLCRIVSQPMVTHRRMKSICPRSSKIDRQDNRLNSCTPEVSGWRIRHTMIPTRLGSCLSYGLDCPRRSLPAFRAPCYFHFPALDVRSVSAQYEGILNQITYRQVHTIVYSLHVLMSPRYPTRI